MSEEGALKKVARAATNLLNVGVAGAAGAGALLIHSWPIAAAGGVAYAALVAWDFVTKDEKNKTRVSARPAMPDAKKVVDPSIRAIVQSLARARADLERVLAETPPDVAANLALTLVTANALEDRAVDLVRRGDELARYLTAKDPRVFAQEAQALVNRAREARDPEARAQYESAGNVRREHGQVIAELLAAKERIHATLLGIAATLEALPPKVVKMRALDSAAMNEQSGNLKGELEAMNGELEALEEALSTMTESAP